MESFTEKSRKKDQRSVFGAPSTGVPVSAVEDRVVRQECARFSRELMLTLLSELTEDEKRLKAAICGQNNRLPENMEPPAISAADYDYGAFRSEENIFAEGNVVHVLRHLRYDRHEMHSHDFFEIAYGVSGNGLVTLADRKIQLGAGDIIFFSPGTEHKLTADSDDTVILKIIMRRGDFDCIYRDVLRSDSPLSAFFRASLEKSGGGWLMFRAGGDDELLDIMLKMRFSEVRRGRVDNILKEALAMQVFCILVTDHAESARVSFGSDVTGKIIIHISSHFEDITLDKLSRVFHFTPEYISKLVKKATGKSFTSLVIGLKLAAAKRLLISTDLEVSEIYRSVGFGCKEFFYKKFREENGCSPLEWREPHRQNHEFTIES